MINSVLKHRIYLLLVVVVLFSGILRFYKIDQFPLSLYWDEVSSTYNAYSILETGKDEFGNSFPLLFRAFEDYKTPANIYLTTLSVKIFGLNEFSARFSSAFLGTFTVLMIFFLIKELLKQKIPKIDEKYLALLTSLLIGISPWHIQFSRTGFEANSGLFFVITGAFFFFKFINIQKTKYLVLSAIFFGTSIYFYRSIWVFVPLFLLSIIIIHRKELFSKATFKKSLISMAVLFIIVLPFIPVMFSKQGMIRANQVAVVYNSDGEVFKAAKRQQEANNLLGKVIYNRRAVYLLESGVGYFKHFSPNFLFFNGDGNGRHGVRGVGVLYLWGIIFILPGIFMLGKVEKKARLSIISWLLIGPIAAAISIPSPHSLRSLNMIPIPQLILSLGVFWFFLIINRKYWKTAGALLTGMMLYFLVNYLSLYFGENAIKTSGQWADGYKQLTNYVFENESNYEKVLISGHYWQPYVYFLFYKNYNPSDFQKTGKKSGFENYVFGGTSWDMGGRELGEEDLKKLAGTNNILVALSPIEYSFQKQKVNVVKEIKNHNNELMFIMGTMK